jgi:hypothetical protein
VWVILAVVIEGCELEIAGTIPSDGCGDLGAELTVELLVRN